MHKKRILSIMLTLILFIGLITGNCSDVIAESIDTSLPENLNVRISSNDFRFGDIANIRIQTSESMDDLGDKAYITYKIRKGNDEITKEIQLNKNGRSFVADFEIDEKFESGLWQVDFLVVSKKGTNVVLYNENLHGFKEGSVNYRDLSHANFSVEEIADYQLFKTASTDVNYVKLFDTVLLSVETTDKEIDLLDEAYASYVLKGENETLTREITLNRTGKNLYEREILIDETYREGTWKLDYVVLKEKSGTTKVVYNKDMHGNAYLDCFKGMSSADIIVQADTVGPEIVAINKEQIVNMPGTYEVKILARDESGLNKNAWLKYVASNADGSIKEAEVTLELQEGEYVGTVVLDHYSEWNVEFILLKDLNGNTDCIYNKKMHNVNSVNLDSLMVTEDNEIPSIQKMELNRSEIDGRYALKIYPDKKASELESMAYAVYETKEQGVIIEKEVKLNLVDGVYIGKFGVEEYAFSLEWNVKCVIIKDLIGNTGVYFNNKQGDGGENFINMDAVSFTSEGDDSDGPEFVNIRMNQESTFVEMEILANDKGSELGEWSYVVLRNTAGNEKEAKLKLNDGRYKGTVEFGSENDNEEWFVDYIILKDVMDNEAIVYNSELHGNFESTIDMSSVVIKLPKSKVMSISQILKEKKIFEQGEEIKVELKVGEGVFPLCDEAYVSYIKKVNDKSTSKEIKFTKIDANTYEGMFPSKSYDDLGDWKVDYIIISDEENNKNIVYNSEINGLGQDLSTGEIVVGEVVVHRAGNKKIQSGIDFVESFIINNYVDQDKDVSVVVEIKDKNKKLISRVNAKKFIKTRSEEMIDVRMRINQNAKYISIIVLDSRGNEVYRIIDCLPLN